MTLWRFTLAVLLALGATGAQAAGLEERSAGNFRYLSGGVGQEEVQAMRQAAPRYNLGMTFTTDTGEYVSDVKVVIKKPKGDTAATLVSDGPMVLINLPPGQYTVEASLDGKIQTRKVSIGKTGRRQLVMRWAGS